MHLDVSMYARELMNWKQMREVRLGLEEELEQQALVIEDASKGHNAEEDLDIDNLLDELLAGVDEELIARYERGKQNIEKVNKELIVLQNGKQKLEAVLEKISNEKQKEFYDKLSRAVEEKLRERQEHQDELNGMNHLLNPNKVANVTVIGTAYSGTMVIADRVQYRVRQDVSRLIFKCINNSVKMFRL